MIRSKERGSLLQCTGLAILPEIRLRTCVSLGHLIGIAPQYKVMVISVPEVHHIIIRVDLISDALFSGKIKRRSAHLSDRPVRNRLFICKGHLIRIHDQTVI